MDSEQWEAWLEGKMRAEQLRRPLHIWLHHKVTKHAAIELPAHVANLLQNVMPMIYHRFGATGFVPASELLYTMALAEASAYPGVQVRPQALLATCWALDHVTEIMRAVEVGVVAANEVN